MVFSGAKERIDRVGECQCGNEQSEQVHEDEDEPRDRILARPVGGMREQFAGAGGEEAGEVVTIRCHDVAFCR
jgi:hypothetical protein